MPSSVSYGFNVTPCLLITLSDLVMFKVDNFCGVELAFSHVQTFRSEHSPSESSGGRGSLQPWVCETDPDTSVA
jgi:hypothetical protein